MTVIGTLLGALRQAPRLMPRVVAVLGYSGAAQ